MDAELVQRALKADGLAVSATVVETRPEVVEALDRGVPDVILSDFRGSELLHGSCIIAVADTVEAMASHRPYRPARGLGSALAQIEHDRGTVFAVDAVDACVGLFHERGFVFHVA